MPIKEVEYLEHAGVRYRNLGIDDERVSDGESIHKVYRYYNPTHIQTFRIAVVGGIKELLILLNHWNKEIDTGWTYYTREV